MRLRPVLAAVAAAGLASLAWAGAVAPAAGATPAASAQPAGKHAARVCAQVVTGASCQALRLDPATSSAGVTPAAATPSGLFPADLQSAYKLPSATAGAGQTVAIVDAYDDPTAEADLGVYRSPVRPAGVHHRQRLLPQGRPERRHQLPAQERRLGRGDLARPRHGLRDLPELPHPAGRGERRNSFANLGAAVNRAATHGRQRDQQQLRRLGRVRRHQRLVLQPPRHRDHRLARATAATASSSRRPRSYVTAVGGTSLRTAAGNTRGWTETAWSGAGSGCSTFNTALSGAASFNTGCAAARGRRRLRGRRPEHRCRRLRQHPVPGLRPAGWSSAAPASSSPIIAGVYALAGNAATHRATTTRTRTPARCST